MSGPIKAVATLLQDVGGFLGILILTWLRHPPRRPQPVGAVGQVAREHWGQTPVKLTMQKLLFLLIVALGFVAGCGHPPHTNPKTTPPATGQPTALSETEVLAIARQAVATNDTWVDRAEFATPRRQADGSWSVLVWRLPKAPGGHRVIYINDKGQVTSYHRGA